MAAALRASLANVLGRNLTVPPAAVSVAFTQHRNITGRTMRGGPRVPKCAPYPYKERLYTIFHTLLDKTSHRLDENSKLICIDGPIAAGKDKFAQELATELDMLYMKPMTLDYLYINSYGFDLRQLDPQLPESVRSYDVTNFCREPRHRHAAQFQMRMYTLRYMQHIDAIAHILSTGQGVVMQRSAHSDSVFLEAMFRQGYVSRGVREYYHEFRNTTLGELLKPHLVIYLDLPVEQVKQRIKQRNLDYEQSSPAFTDAYLQDIEHLYKQQYLKEISRHAELLIYDWTAGGETEVVVEDIERIDFAALENDSHEKKLSDWRYFTESDWCDQRVKFTGNKWQLIHGMNVPCFHVPELVRDADSSKKLREVYGNAPGQKYVDGYNADMGDQNILFKTKTNYNEPLSKI